jgi:hypothetical protein
VGWCVDDYSGEIIACCEFRLKINNCSEDPQIEYQNITTEITERTERREKKMQYLFSISCRAIS